MKLGEEFDRKYRGSPCDPGEEEKEVEEEPDAPGPLEGLSNLPVGNSPWLIRSHSPTEDTLLFGNSSKFRGTPTSPLPRQANLEFERDSHDLFSQ